MSVNYWFWVEKRKEWKKERKIEKEKKKKQQKAKTVDGESKGEDQ